MLDCWQESGYDMSELEPDNDIHRCGKCVIPIDKQVPKEVMNACLPPLS